MNFPQNLKYTNEHEWIRVEGDIAYVGITDYAQEQLGDIVFVDIPTVGETLEAGETFGTIEVVKTISDLFLPFFFGMYTLFDGWGWYVSSFNVSINFSIRFRLMLSMV